MSAIQEAFATIQRRRVIVIAMLIVGLIGIFVFLRVTPRSYLGYAQVLTVVAKDGRESAVSTNDLPSFATSTVVLQRVIERLNLPETLAAELNPYVQGKYKDTWQIVHSNPP